MSDQLPTIIGPGAVVLPLDSLPENIVNILALAPEKRTPEH